MYVPLVLFHTSNHVYPIEHKIVFSLFTGIVYYIKLHDGEVYAPIIGDECLVSQVILPLCNCVSVGINFHFFGHVNNF